MSVSPSRISVLAYNTKGVYKYCMPQIYASRGITINYMGTPIHTTFYSVIHNNTLIIRTSSKRIAIHYYLKCNNNTHAL